MSGSRRTHAPAGPGRGKRSRARGRSRNSSGASPTPIPDPAAPTPKAPQVIRSGVVLTRKAIALIIVMLVLTISYATALRTYFDQKIKIGEQVAAIEAKKRSIDTLTDEITRWNDDEYVKAQARSRMGWVFPGEVGYRVIGPDGKPLGAGVEIEREGKTPEALAGWWQRMIWSIEVADKPEG